MFSKIVATVLCLFQLLFQGVSYGELTPYAEQKKDVIPLHSVEGDGNLASSVEYAAKIRNKISASFTDSSRNAIMLQNSTMALQHNLNSSNALASFMNSKGECYAADTFDCFYSAAGERHNASDSVAKGRVNTIRLGEYYYETHIRDLDFRKSSLEKKVFGLDKCFHIYGDRLYLQCSLLAAEATTALQTFGTEVKIPVSSVSALRVSDNNGTRSTLAGLDSATVAYVAFDIKNTGVLGFIVPADGSCQSLSVTEKDGNYVVTLLANYTPGTGINRYDETGGYELNCVTFGMRIWNDETHSFAGVEKAARQERTPLQGITVSAGNANAYYVGYEALRGTYTLHMDGTDFNVMYRDAEHQYQVPVSVTCDDADRDIMIRSNGAVGCLEAAAVLDGDGNLSALETEVCKNFQGDGGEDFYSIKDYQYGDTFFPISLKANQTVNFTLLNLYYCWGKNPLKQLSSIEFHVSYYHLSTGTTESNCIAPYFVFDRDGWTLPDFRCRSGKEWESQPQYNSVGVLRFVTYRKGLWRNNNVYSEFQNSRIDSAGLAYADVTNDYVSDCGSYRYSLRHVEMPQTDENRTYYTLQIDFDRNITFADFQKDFDLFNFNGRFVDFEKMGYLNSNNEPTVTNVSHTGTKNYVLGDNAPYFGLYQVTEDKQDNIAKGFGCNFALLIKNSKMIIGGKETSIPFVVRQGTEENNISTALTLQAKKLAFKAGDSITMNLILLPWGVGTETDDSQVLAVREDSILKPAVLTATRGTAEQDAFIPTVKAQNNTAEFTLTGGRNNISVKVTGVTAYGVPTVEKQEGGQWKTLSLASRNGYDGYTVKYEDDGTYTYSFVIHQESPDSAVHLRFSAQQPV